MPDLRGPDRQPAFLGIPTYIHSPLALSQEELAEMQADVAVIGAPVDMGVVNRPGARFGPRAIRQAGYCRQPERHLLPHGVRALSHARDKGGGLRGRELPPKFA